MNILRWIIGGEEKKFSAPANKPVLESEVIAPYAGHKCPFYGFVACGDFFMGEPAGNGCALTGEHSPCKMEMGLSTPDWDKCRFYNHPQNEEVLGHIMKFVSVAPKAFWPKGATAWAGIKFGDWFECVMGRKFS